MDLKLRNEARVPQSAAKQASRIADAMALSSGQKSVTDLRRENEAFSMSRSSVTIGFARAFSQ